MKNNKLEKIYSFIVIVFFLTSYFLYSFLEPPIYSLSKTPGDTFYYFVYGREAANLNFFSWNGLYPSNGFHPLWLLFVAISFIISENLVIVIYVLSIFLFIFLIISLWSIYKVNRIYDDKLVQIISTFLFSILATKYFFWYMESALSTVLFLIYIYLVAFKFTIKNKKNTTTIFNISVVSSLVALSRLDLILLITPIHGYIIVNSLIKKNLKIPFILSLVPILIVGGYIFLIYIITGSPVPLSGVIKSYFPNINPNLNLHNLLTNQIKYGIFACSITFIFIVGTLILERFIKKKFINPKLKSFQILNYFLLIGMLLHTFYHVIFSQTGAVGRWYFIVHLNISILSLSVFTNYLIIFFKSNFKFISVIKNKVIIFFIILSLPLIFFNSITARQTVEYKKDLPYGKMGYKKKEPYAVMKFVEMLETKNFDKSKKIFDGTDGNFAFFSKIPTYHMKGMSSTPDYVFKKKRIIKKFMYDNDSLKDAKNKFKNDFLLEKKIDYVLINTASKIHYSRKFKTDTENELLEKCIKEISEYNMIGSGEDFITHFYLVKTEIYLKNKNLCRGI